MKFSDPIDIPSSAQGWPLAQTPITRRLRNALHRQGYRLLGELHGLMISDVWKVRGCGVGAVEDFRKFLERLHGEEFSKFGTTDPKEALTQIVSVVNRFCSALASRERDIVLSRLGGRKQSLALAKIGKKYHVTRERIRQIVNLHLDELRRHGGPPFLHLILALAQRCADVVCPLTPELLEEWFNANRPLRYKPAFYVRVIAELMPGCPAWPEMQGSGIPTERQTQIASATRLLLQGRSKPIPAREALLQLNAQEQFDSLTSIEFLAAIRMNDSFGLRFAKPDQLLLLPPMPDPVECVKQVLLVSEKALSLDAIIVRAREIWGDKALVMPAYRLTRSFRVEDGIYLLGEAVYGLRKHIRLPDSLWPTVCENVRGLLLNGEDWTISTFDIIKRRKFDWTRTINAYELAVILRADGDFTETERGTFLLSTPTRTFTAPLPAVATNE